MNIGRQTRLLFGVSIFWLALSALSDGINTLVLPIQVGKLTGQNNEATILGALTFVGLLAGALIQPIAGAFSDRLQPLLGRKGFIGIGLLLSLTALLLFTVWQSLVGIMIAYLAIMISASIAQAGQQALLPDLVDENRRGIASGMKGLMDLAGAMFGFILLGQLLRSGNLSLAIAAVGGLLIFSYLLAVTLTPEDRANKHAAIKTTAVPLREIFHLNLSRHRAFVRLLIARFLFLLGIYGTGRFLLLFVANRLGLPADQAAEQAGNLLAGLALVTVLASPLTGWLADRIGRLPLMVAGAVFGAASTLLLVWANSPGQMLLFGGLMSLGSAAFSGGSWALLADLVPREEAARFFGLANFSTAGAAAAAGLFGPIIDGAERLAPGMGFSALFIAASLAFLVSALPLRGKLWKEVGEDHGNKRKIRTHDSRLVIVSLSADPAGTEEDQNPSGGTPRL